MVPRLTRRPFSPSILGQQKKAGAVLNNADDGVGLDNRRFQYHSFITSGTHEAKHDDGV